MKKKKKLYIYVFKWLEKGSFFFKKKKRNLLVSLEKKKKKEKKIEKQKKLLFIKNEIIYLQIEYLSGEKGRREGEKLAARKKIKRKQEVFNKIIMRDNMKIISR